MQRMICLALIPLLLLGCAASFDTPDAQPVMAEQNETFAPTAAPTSAPTETPTNVPTETPSPEPTHEPTPEPITAEQLDAGLFDAYFDDAVFFGDSMTKAFGNYVTDLRGQYGACLGTAKFLGVVSLTVRVTASGESIFSYRGWPVSMTEAIRRTEAKKVFFLLGANDIGWRDWEQVLHDYQTIFERIRTDFPNVTIAVIGINPGTEAFCRNRNLDIAHWNSFNDVLRALCEANDVDFLTFAEELMDERGYLKPEYAQGDLHLSSAGNTIWLRALRIYAARKLRPDAALILSSDE